MEKIRRSHKLILFKIKAGNEWNLLISLSTSHETSSWLSILFRLKYACTYVRFFPSSFAQYVICIYLFVILFVAQKQLANTSFGWLCLFVTGCSCAETGPPLAVLASANGDPFNKQ